MAHKISLSQQIDEVEAELKKRADVYPRLVHAGKMRGSLAEYKVARMNAVRDTLKWLSIYEDEIRAHIRSKHNADTSAG
jgi:hypothetical protein